jgi:hypothetical protein
MLPPLATTNAPMAVNFDEFLTDWQTPKALGRVLDGMRTSYASNRIFNDPKLNKRYRELWAGLAFCRATSSRKIRWTKDDAKNSDFEVTQRDGIILPLQFVEADLPGRRRGDEYRRNAGKYNRIAPDPFTAWQTRRSAIPIALAETIKKKAAKNYPPNVGLLIFLNLETYGEWYEEIEREMANFRSVWVIWSGRLYRAMPNPSVGYNGPMFTSRQVILGEWRNKLATQHAFNNLFDE